MLDVLVGSSGEISSYMDSTAPLGFATYDWAIISGEDAGSE